MKHRRAAAIASAAWLLSACALTPPVPVGLLDVSSRPAEKALLAGLKAYDDAQYDIAEKQFTLALASGLASPKDRAEAHKRLAFIDCAGGRVDACEAEFRKARGDDPKFALDAAEAGHPVWGPVYARLSAH